MNRKLRRILPPVHDIKSPEQRCLVDTAILVQNPLSDLTRVMLRVYPSPRDVQESKFRAFWEEQRGSS